MLVIGKRFTKSNPNKIGGVIMLFELFIKDLTKLGIEPEITDLNWRNYPFRILAYPTILLKIMAKAIKHDYIIFHGTANEYIYIAPIVVLWGKLISRKIILRKFAGNFNEIYKNSNFIQRKLIEFSLKNADFIFFETKYLVKYFKKFNINTYWFPNVREKQDIETNKKFTFRYIFIGHIKKEKGIDEILEVSNMLDKRYQIDLYGPLDKNYNKNHFKKYKATYKGVLDPKDLIETLTLYDVLLLPTYWKGEGYPGVIIEAMSIGLPVIATNLQGIKEIVDSESGILINKKDVTQLKKAIQHFNDENYNKYTKGAKQRFKYFDSQIQTKKFLEYIGFKKINCGEKIHEL